MDAMTFLLHGTCPTLVTRASGSKQGRTGASFEQTSQQRSQQHGRGSLELEDEKFEVKGGRASKTENPSNE